MNHKAFTLIELLVVVLIIGILSAIALPQYSQAVEKSRAAEALSNLGSFGRALDIWKLGNPDKCRCFTGSCGGFGELDIGIPDDWVQGTNAMMSSTDYPSGKSCSKNFCYGIGLCGSYELKAYRANSSTYKYAIMRDVDDNHYQCYARTPADLKICKSLSNMTVTEAGNGWSL